MKRLPKCSHKDFKLKNVALGEMRSRAALGRQDAVQAGDVPKPNKARKPFQFEAASFQSM